MTIEELKAKLDDLTSKYDELSEEKESLLSKNQQLIKEKRVLKSKFEEIDPEQYTKVVEELDELKTSYAKLEKESKLNLEKLGTDLSNKDSFLQKVLIEDGLTKALLDAGISKEFLKPALAMLKSETKIIQDESGYKAFISDKGLDEFIPNWINEGDGNIFKTFVPNSGGGSKGGSNASGSEYAKYFDKSNAEFSLTKQAELFKSNPELFNQLKGK